MVTQQLLTLPDFVRFFNDSGASAVVFTQDANYAGIGSITVKDDEVVLLEKHPEDNHLLYWQRNTLKLQESESQRKNQ